MMNGGPMTPKRSAEAAVSAVGCGYDLADDLRLSSCKPAPSESRLIELDETLVHDLALPGGVVVVNVPEAVRCDKGERTRFRSDVLSFQQMAEQFNQDLSIPSKIPSGLFNAMFYFHGCWQKDLPGTKSLAFDGWFITLYSIELARSQIVLHDKVKQDVPSSWDPAALAEFIEKYGTHIIIGIKMGGKDVVSLKQLQDSALQQTDVQHVLKNLADDVFSEDFNANFLLGAAEISKRLKVDSKNRPVTGIRLFLEGKRNNCLAVHLQHLSTSPTGFQLSDAPSHASLGDVPANQRAYFEPIKWALLSHVCTAPVQLSGASIDDPASFVTKAWLEVRDVVMRKVLFLKLGFSSVVGMRIRRSE